jgi:hypothetical protein
MVPHGWAFVRNFQSPAALHLAAGLIGESKDDSFQSLAFVTFLPMRRFSIYNHAAKAPKPIRNENRRISTAMLLMVMTSGVAD